MQVHHVRARRPGDNQSRLYSSKKGYASLASERASCIQTRSQTGAADRAAIGHRARQHRSGQSVPSVPALRIKVSSSPAISKAAASANSWFRPPFPSPPAIAKSVSVSPPEITHAGGRTGCSCEAESAAQSQHACAPRRAFPLQYKLERISVRYPRFLRGRAPGRLQRFLIAPDLHVLHVLEQRVARLRRLRARRFSTAPVPC